MPEGFVGTYPLFEHVCMSLRMRREPPNTLFNTLTQLTILTSPTRPLNLRQSPKRIGQPRQISLHIRPRRFRIRPVRIRRRRGKERFDRRRQ